MKIIVFGLVIDASAKLQSGLLYGNIYQVGNYDQCLNINKNPPNKSDNLVRGQYCTVMLFPTINSTTELSFLLNSDSVSSISAFSNTNATLKINSSYLTGLVFEKPNILPIL